MYVIQILLFGLCEFQKQIFRFYWLFKPHSQVKPYAQINERRPTLLHLEEQ